MTIFCSSLICEVLWGLFQFQVSKFLSTPFLKDPFVRHRDFDDVFYFNQSPFLKPPFIRHRDLTTFLVKTHFFKDRFVLNQHYGPSTRQTRAPTTHQGPGTLSTPLTPWRAQTIIPCRGAKRREIAFQPLLFSFTSVLHLNQWRNNLVGALTQKLVRTPPKKFL